MSMWPLKTICLLKVELEEMDKFINASESTMMPQIMSFSSPSKELPS